MSGSLISVHNRQPENGFLVYLFIFKVLYERTYAVGITQISLINKCFIFLLVF